MAIQPVNQKFDKQNIEYKPIRKKRVRSIKKPTWILSKYYNVVWLNDLIEWIT